MSAKTITLSNKDKLSLVDNLSTMLSSGIPILETVDTLLEDSKGNLQKILQSIREGMIQGQHLYVIFGNFPQVFDKVTINVLRASEEAGTLDQTLKDVKAQIKREIEFNDKIKSALTYPIVISAVFLLVLFVVLVVVIPRISSVFINLNLALPLPTRVMIFMSNLVLHNTLLFFGGTALFVFGVYMLFKKQKKFLLHIIFYLPIMRRLLADIDLTRFFRSMYLLLSSGVTITAALELTQEVVQIQEISKVISQAREMVLSGRRLSEGFKTNRHIFPSTAIKIIEAGERTGTLDQSMQNISENFDYQVSNSLKTVISLMEPLMLVFVGFMVGGMMLAIIAPIYGLISQVGGGH